MESIKNTRRLSERRRPTPVVGHLPGPDGAGPPARRRAAHLEEPGPAGHAQLLAHRPPPHVRPHRHKGRSSSAIPVSECFSSVFFATKGLAPIFSVAKDLLSAFSAEEISTSILFPMPGILQDFSYSQRARCV